MRLRDRAFIDYRGVFVVSGVSGEIVEGLPRALKEVLRDPLVGGFNLPAKTHGTDFETRALAEALVHLNEELSEVDLMKAALRRPFGLLRGYVLISGNRVALYLPHSSVDGRGGIEVLTHLLQRAANLPVSHEPFPLARTPVFSVLRTLRWPAVRRYLTDRRQGRLAMTPESFRIPKDGDLNFENAKFENFIVPPDEVKRVVFGASGLGTPQSSKNSRLASVVLAAMREVYSGNEDLSVQIPIDLRILLPRKRVEGNFVSVAPLGRFLSSDWSPGSISESLAATMASGTPIVNLAAGLARTARGMIRKRAPGAGGVHSISISMIGSKSDFPAQSWAPGSAHDYGCTLVGPWPSSTFVFVSTLGGTVRISMWDESGFFDVDRFKDAFFSEVAQRVARRERAEKELSS
jgi:hypothetical protein